MKNSEIHDLINLKARRLEIEVGLGISNIEMSHLSKAQVDRINHDHNTQFSALNKLNNVIKTDERIIYSRH